MLRLKGQTESGEWVEFYPVDIVDTFEDEIKILLDKEIWVYADTIRPADDPRKAMSEHEVLTRVQAMGEESLSPDNFEGLMRALEALKTTRNVDGDRVDPGAELAARSEQVRVLRATLEEISQECVKEELVDGLGWFHEVAEKALEQTKPKNEDPEKLARLIASRVNGFGLASARKLVFRLGTLDNIINAEPADLDAIFGKGSIKSIHLHKYLDDPVAVERLRDRLQTKPKDGE